MAKKAKKEVYEYVRAIVDCGNLRFEYKLVGGPVNTMGHDEDVSGWSDREIARCARGMLSMDDTEAVEVIYH